MDHDVVIVDHLSRHRDDAGLDAYSLTLIAMIGQPQDAWLQVSERTNHFSYNDYGTMLMARMPLRAGLEVYDRRKLVHRNYKAVFSTPASGSIRNCA